MNVVAVIRTPKHVLIAFDFKNRTSARWPKKPYLEIKFMLTGQPYKMGRSLEAKNFSPKHVVTHPHIYDCTVRRQVENSKVSPGSWRAAQCSWRIVENF